MYLTFMATVPRSRDVFVLANPHQVALCEYTGTRPLYPESPAHHHSGFTTRACAVLSRRKLAAFLCIGKI